MRLEGDRLRSSVGAVPHVPVTGPRQQDDFYRTHPSALDALLDREPFQGTVWEPACGDGILVERMLERGMRVFASDIHPTGYGACGWDFLDDVSPTLVYDHIITNPPYNLAEQFALRAGRREDHRGLARAGSDVHRDGRGLGLVPDVSDPYFESYKTLPSSTLRAMLPYEGKVEGSNVGRYDVVRYLLRQKRVVSIRVSRHGYQEKLL